jgi:hypothetical protein
MNGLRELVSAGNDRTTNDHAAVLKHSYRLNIWDMTYYDTPAGAKVFAAGAFSIAGSVWQGHVRQLVTNLWDWMAKD